MEGFALGLEIPHLMMYWHFGVMPCFFMTFFSYQFVRVPKFYPPIFSYLYL